MKTEEERHDLAVDYVESTYPYKVEGTFEKHQMASAYCKGFIAGREDAEADCNNPETLGGWFNKFKALEKLAKKADLYITAEICFRSNHANVTIYEYRNERLGDTLFCANNHFASNTGYRMMEYLLMAEEFICKYTANTEDNLEKKLESLRAELAATRKSLAKVRKLSKNYGGQTKEYVICNSK